MNPYVYIIGTLVVLSTLVFFAKPIILKPLKINVKNYSLSLRLIILLCLTIIALFLTMFLSLNKINELSNRLNCYTNRDRCVDLIDSNLPSEEIDYISTNYKDYFGGFLEDNDSYKFLITNDSPTELKEYLNSNGFSYEMVTNIDSNISALSNYIEYEIIDDLSVFSLSIDSEDDQIVIGATTNFNQSYLQYYIDKEILRISFGNPINLP